MSENVLVFREHINVAGTRGGRLNAQRILIASVCVRACVCVCAHTYGEKEYDKQDTLLTWGESGQRGYRILCRLLATFL